MSWISWISPFLFVLLISSAIQICLSEDSTSYVNPEVAGATPSTDVFPTESYQSDDCSTGTCTRLDFFTEKSAENNCKKGVPCEDLNYDLSAGLEDKEEALENNKTVENVTETPSGAPKKVECSNEVLDNWTEESESPSVKIVEGHQLNSYLTHNPNITSRSTVAPCVLVYFYTSWCHHSARAAPHMNALPRAFPSIPMVATDSMKHHSVNTQHGIMAVPSLMLFHNGRPVSRFNESEYDLSAFANFITRNTGLEPVCQLNVTSKDYNGPLLPTVIPETDYILLLSWTFILFASVYLVAKTPLWRTALGSVFRRRQVEAVHEHVE